MVGIWDGCLLNIFGDRICFEFRCHGDCSKCGLTLASDPGSAFLQSLWELYGFYSCGSVFVDSPFRGRIACIARFALQRQEAGLTAHALFHMPEHELARSLGRLSGVMPRKTNI